VPWRDFLFSRAFWIPSLALASISGTCQAIVITLVPYGVQLGFAATTAALLISAFAISAGVTKVLAGLLADHIAPRALLIAASLFMMASLALLDISTGYWTLLGGSCLAGIALGCALPTAAALIARNFGAAGFGGVMGWTYALTLTLAIVETLVVGSIYDKAKAYGPAFIAFFVFSVCVLVVTLLFKPKEQMLDA
jgi:MFS family permease